MGYMLGSFDYSAAFTSAPRISQRIQQNQKRLEKKAVWNVTGRGQLLDKRKLNN